MAKTLDDHAAAVERSRAEGSLIDAYNILRAAYDAEREARVKAERDKVSLEDQVYWYKNR
jgi:hypothetical protein